MKKIFSSDNALVSALTIILSLTFGLFSVNGLELPENAAQDTVTAVQNLDFLQILTVIFPSILLPTFKFLKNGFPNVWHTFKGSGNFRTMATVAVVGLFALAGVSLQVPGVTDFFDLVANTTTLDVATVISLLAALLHAINSGLHIKATAISTVKKS